MSQTLVPVPPPWWRNPTFFLAALAVIAEAPDLINQLSPVLPAEWAAKLRVIAIICAAISSVTAHAGATRNAAKLDVHGLGEAMKVLGNGREQK